MEEQVMKEMSKEKAKLIHLKARKQYLEGQLVKLADADEVDLDQFLAASREIDTIDHKIQVQENFLEEGFNTRVKNTSTIPSSIRPRHFARYKI